MFERPEIIMRITYKHCFSLFMHRYNIIKWSIVRNVYCIVYIYIKKILCTTAQNENLLSTYTEILNNKPLTNKRIVKLYLENVETSIRAKNNNIPVYICM